MFIFRISSTMEITVDVPLNGNFAIQLIAFLCFCHSLNITPAEVIVFWGFFLVFFFYLNILFDLSGHFLPVQRGRNLAIIGPIPNAKYPQFFPMSSYFFPQKNDEKNATKKKQQQQWSIVLNLSIDHTVSVTTCNCKQLFIILVKPAMYTDGIEFTSSMVG